ncbi:hypothetical protein RJ639_008955 [Escallonia herrerae]|uniref:urease n=1 Tax=Escallonia herrerae TaxID=1293975 RepID=A0AA88VZ57_9ASTE|nr:hypothetical protein RJ639_008955 [Escallonia herrerae]
MRLSPREVEKLMLHNAGYLAQKRLARGLRLNYTEAVALIASQAYHIKLNELKERHVEGTFSDGTKLITIHDAISSENGNLELALHGSFLPVPSLEKFTEVLDDIIPGEFSFGGGCITLNSGRKAVILKVTNTGDRPIQVGSHYHFIEVNPFLVFDRMKAYGMRLNIPAGTATRFEPGDTKSVVLIKIGGKQVIRGGNRIVDGLVHDANIAAVSQAVHTRRLGHAEEINASEGVTEEGSAICSTISREAYANMYGPTAGDKIRLGDTELFAEIERDFAVYGDECVFGGGKVLRDGMGQACGYSLAECLDTVITNAVIIDYTGIFKADIGIKGGDIVSLGKAGNPDMMHVDMIIGVNTEVIAAEGKIVTAGAIDCHVHFICPQLVYEAVSSAHMATEIEVSVFGPPRIQGNTSKPEGLHEIIRAGAMGLKLHEDWGTTPAAIDNCLIVAEQHDIQVNIHTDTLNESGFVEHTISAFKDRTIHTYHSEGAGGGHAPDIIKVCGVKNVLPSSTNPTRPFTLNTIDEHLDMLMVCHHLDKDIPEDVAFAESRIRAETIAAEDILHDMGAISIIASDSQAMGRIGEELVKFAEFRSVLYESNPKEDEDSVTGIPVISRTWQTAHKMKLLRGSGDASGTNNDNLRIKRYIAKYTINPAIANGFSQHVGSVEVGKLADLVIWKPSFFGVKPEMVIKGGEIAWANMGDPNASIPTPEPAAVACDIKSQYGLNKRVEAVGNVRKLTKLDMKLNDALPNIEVDPETYTVTADGVVLTCDAATTVPLSRNYFLF